MSVIRGKLTDKIIAIILLISLTITDFLFVGKSLISYALDVVKTNNANVEFTAYFMDNTGVKLEKIEKEIQDENTKLYIEVSVKNEGYFNGKILLNNNNFNIEQSGENEYVEKIENNEVTLKQINAGNTAFIELKVTSIKDEKITYSKLFGETSILLKGAYIDGISAQNNTYIPIDGETKVEVDWKSNDSINMELDAKILTNYIYKIDEQVEQKEGQNNISIDNNETNINTQENLNNEQQEVGGLLNLESVSKAISMQYNKENDITQESLNKRIVQILINSKIKDNSYPAKNTKISLNVPKNTKDVKVHTRTNSATNANQIFNEKNYKYDEANSKLEIDITNEDENNISWRKNAEDIIIVTYILDENEPVENTNINITGTILTYDEKKLTANKNINVDTQIDGIVSFESNVEEKSIYKGKLYTGEAREYRTTETVNIDYVGTKEGIVLNLKEANYLIDKNPVTANILYKQIQIKKQELTEIFGEDGYITIKDENQNVLANINSETEVDEKGNIIIKFLQGAKSLELSTSIPKKVGILNIINTKEILNKEYDHNMISSLTAIRESTELKNRKDEKEITLLNTTTEAILETENSVISEKNNELILITTLNAKNESKDLFKNPNLTITLPEGIKVNSVQYRVLYQNGLNIESCVLKNSDKSRIDIQLEGEQLLYDVQGGTKVYVKLTDIEINPLMPSQNSYIEMTYTNEKSNIINTIQKEIKIENQYGLILYNNITGHNDQENLISKDGSNMYGKLEMNTKSKEVTLTTTMLNNFGQEINNVTLIGKIPSISENSTFNSYLNPVSVDYPNAQILYSEKTDVALNDSNWGEYTANSKFYKITLNSIKPMQIIKTSVKTIIPENLGYNQVGTYNINLTYYLNEIKQESNVQAILTTEKSEEAFLEQAVNTKTEKGLDVSILTMDGDTVLKENDEVYEGQKLKYKVKIANNTGKDYQNIKVKAIQKNGYAWGIIEKQARMHATQTDFVETNVKFYRAKDSNETDEITIENLKNGESYEYSYEIDTYLLNNKELEGNETFSTIYITDKDSLNEQILTAKNKIKSAELKVDVYNGLNEEYIWDEKGIKPVDIKLTNLKDSQLQNVELKITLSKEVDITKENLDTSIEYNKENLNLKSIQNNKNDEIVLTFNIQKMEPNSQEKINMTLNTKLINEQRKKIFVLASATTDLGNIYINKFEKEINRVHNDISASLVGSINGKALTEKTQVNDGDEVLLTATLENKEQYKDIEMSSAIDIDSSLNIQKAILVKNGNEEDITKDVDRYYLSKNISLKAGENAKIYITTKVDGEFGGNAINELNAADSNGGTLINNKVEFTVNGKNDLASESNKENSSNEVVENINNTNNNEETKVAQQNNYNETIYNKNTKNDNEEMQNTDEQKYKVNGTVWVDENKNGIKDTNEKTLNQVEVVAINVATNKIVAQTKTNEQGKYSLRAVQGKYIIGFHYDDEQYQVTTYKQIGASEEESSDAITRIMEINGMKVTAGLTDTIELKDNINNINLGLKTRDTFDLKLQKFVNKITVTNEEGTNTYKQQEGTRLAKTEIKAKYLKDSLVVIEYKLKVVNNGDVEGYAKIIEDKLPDGLTFNSNLNPTWYKDGDKIFNASLANTLIKPGETKELTLILTRTMTESNTGLVHNTAKIAESLNLEKIEDKINDNASADVIISVSTGALVNYIVILLNIIILLGLGCYIFVRYLKMKNL